MAKRNRYDAPLDTVVFDAFGAKHMVTEARGKNLLERGTHTETAPERPEAEILGKSRAASLLRPVRRSQTATAAKKATPTKKAKTSEADEATEDSEGTE